ncbi:unnamed protein product, partial [Allacma fusca]
QAYRRKILSLEKKHVFTESLHHAQPNMRRTESCRFFIQEIF